MPEPEQSQSRAAPIHFNFSPTVAFAGRLVWEKGTDVLLQAFARIVSKIPDARLILAGDGPERQSLKKMITRLGLTARVSVTGHLLRQEMERLFDAAWIQVVPSRCDEAFGKAATEAMMRGTAVVASASGGLSEIVQDGQTGVLVPPGDEGALCEALQDLLSNREWAEQMGRAGRDFALVNFDQDRYLDKILQVYQRLYSNRVNPNGN